MAVGNIERVAEATKRHNTFDFIRLVAALSVAVEHSVHHLDARFLWHTQDDEFWFNGGVATFFILSGMMVFKSAERCHADARPWSDFYQNRALRIVPAIYAYFIVLTVMLFLGGLLSVQQIFSGQFAAFAATNLFLVPVWSPPILDQFGIGVVNGSLWTIPVEVSFYVIVPILVLIAHRSGRRVMITTLFTVAAAGVIIYGIVGATASTSMIWKVYGVTFLPYLWWFAIGIFWARAWRHVVHSGWLAAIAIVLYFVVAKLPLDSGAAFIADALGAVPLSYAAIWFGYYGPKVLGKITSRIGDLSFSAYIWHMIIVNLLVGWGAREWAVDGNLLVIGVLLATMVIAGVSWHFVERPALKRKRYTSAGSGAR